MKYWFFLIISSFFSVSFSQPLVGFWGDSMQGVGSGNYMTATAPYSDVIMVSADTREGVLAKVRQAQSLGKRSIVMLQPLLYGWQSAVPRSDFREIFDRLWSELGSLQSSVAGFYLFDEPYWRNETFGQNQVWWGWVRRGLDQAASHIKFRSQKPTMMLFSHHEIDNPDFASQLLSPEIDFIGLNCYLSYGDVCSEEKILHLMETLSKAKYPHQKYIVSMDGWYATDYIKPETDSLLKKRIEFWIRWMGPRSNQIGAVTPFLYQSFEDPSERVTGASQFPMALEALSVYMLAYRNHAFCNGNDLVTSWGATWPQAPYCQPKCEDRNFTRRSLKGEVLDVWWNAPICGNP